MKRILPRLLLTALVSIAFVALPVHAATKHVNCDEGMSISDALETAKGSADVLEIVVSGVCNEVITIRRNRVTITGDPHAVINGRFRVFSANNVNFEHLTITGPGVGLVATGTAGVIAFDTTFAQNQITNVSVRRNATVWLRNSRIEGDCESVHDEDCADGARVDAGTLELWNTTVSGNRYGITADAGARVILDTRPGGVTEIIDNSVVGVQVAFNSVVDIRGDTTFYGNQHHAVYALLGSGVRIAAPSVFIDGNIGCQDWISYLTNPGGGFFSSTSCFMH